MSYLQLRNIRKSFGSEENKIEVLKGINLDINKGEFVVMLGPSGCGKSTLLNIIGGIDTCDEGEVIIHNDSIKHMKEKELTQYRRNHLGYIFQQYNLIGNLTVQENIEVGAYLSKKPFNLKQMLSTLGLLEHKDKLPNQLSGGQQQRTAIGRAVIKNPDLLLCDEPTGALDYQTSKEILQLISHINQEQGNTVIMVTHNEAIGYLADRIILLHDGHVKDNYLNKNKKSIEELEW